MAAAFRFLARTIRKSTNLLLVLLALAALVRAQEAQETLTNEAVVKMVQNHVGAEVIVQAIRSTPGNYLLNASSLIKLKQQGVPDKVIAAMQAANKGAASSAPLSGIGSEISPPRKKDAAEPESAPGSRARGEWKTIESKDTLTDEVNTTLQFFSTGNPVGKFRVTASCYMQDFGSPEVILTFESFTSDFARYADTQTATTQQNFGGTYSTEVTPYTERAHYVVRLGGEDSLRSMQSTGSKGPVKLFLTEDFDVYAHKMASHTTNEMSNGLNQLGNLIGKATGTQIPTGTSSQENTGSTAMGIMEFAIAAQRGLFDSENIQVSDLLRSDSMRIKFTLSDGQATVVSLPIQSTSFNAFVRRCVPPAEPTHDVAPIGAAPTAALPAGPAATPSTVDSYLEGLRKANPGRFDAVPSVTEAQPRTPSSPNPPAAADQMPATKITNWRVWPNSTKAGGAVTLSYTATGSNLRSAELWRAPDLGGQPGRWNGIYAQPIPGAGPKQVTLTDKPSIAGTYWYGSHLIDGAGRTVVEPSPVRVTVYPKSQSIGGALNPANVDIQAANANASMPSRPSSFSASGGPPSAAEILAQAEAKASVEHKSIFLIYGASWCPACAEFEAFFSAPEIRPILDKHFVIRELKVSEKERSLDNPGGGRQLINYVGGGPEVSLPSVVLLDSQGQQIINSNRPIVGKPSGESIGYPAQPQEVEWFMRMLRAAAPSLTQRDASTLESWLQRHEHD